MAKSIYVEIDYKVIEWKLKSESVFKFKINQFSNSKKSQGTIRRFRITTGVEKAHDLVFLGFF